MSRFVWNLVLSGAVLAAVLAGPAISWQTPLIGIKSASLSKPTADQPNVPGLAKPLKFGMYTNDPNPANDNAKLGYQMDIMAWFTHWNGNLKNNKLVTACQQGYVPEITWESWNGSQGAGNYPLAAIAAGKYDGFITAQLRQVQQTCRKQTVIIRFDHEMDLPPGEAGWYPWQGDPSEYIAAWRHVVTLGRRVNPNIKWLWSPNRGTALAADYYPGSEYVDYVGLTLNHENLPEEIQYKTFAAFYGANQRVIESFNKPIIISETTSDEALGNKPAWVRGMFSFAEQNPKITALVWFNGKPGYSYNSSLATLAAFRSSLRTLKTWPETKNPPLKTTKPAASPPACKPTVLMILSGRKC